MLVADDQVRLTDIEKNQLAFITGSDASHIKTVDELEQFVNQHGYSERLRGPGACLAKRLLFSFLPVHEAA